MCSSVLLQANDNVSRCLLALRCFFACVCLRVHFTLPPFSLSLNSSLARDSGLFLPASSFPLALELHEPSSQSSTKTDCSPLHRDSFSEQFTVRGEWRTDSPFNPRRLKAAVLWPAKQRHCRAPLGLFIRPEPPRLTKGSADLQFILLTFHWLACL